MTNRVWCNEQRHGCCYEITSRSSYVSTCSNEAKIVEALLDPWSQHLEPGGEHSRNPKKIQKQYTSDCFNILLQRKSKLYYMIPELCAGINDIGQSNMLAILIKLLTSGTNPSSLYPGNKRVNLFSYQSNCFVLCVRAY